MCTCVYVCAGVRVHLYSQIVFAYSLSSRSFVLANMCSLWRQRSRLARKCTKPCRELHPMRRCRTLIDLNACSPSLPFSLPPSSLSSPSLPFSPVSPSLHVTAQRLRRPGALSQIRRRRAAVLFQPQSQSSHRLPGPKQTLCRVSCVVPAVPEAGS